MIDVKHLFDTIGSVKELDLWYDFSDYELDLSKPFVNPINVVGKISNKAGVTYLNIVAKFTTVFQCDRCLKDFEQDFSLNGDYVLKEEEIPDMDEDRYIVCEKGVLNLKETVLFMILLNMPSKHLCNENCKGLCYSCGANLNDEPCKCGTEDNE